MCEWQRQSKATLALFPITKYSVTTWFNQWQLGKSHILFNTVFIDLCTKEFFNI